MDFGTTNIKTAIVDLDTGIFSYLHTWPPATNISDVPHHCEFSPRQLHETFLSICGFYARRLRVRFEAIAFCSEQNGFMALNEQNEPVTNYVSWKDERSLEPLHDKDTYSLIMDTLGDDFMRITGWRPGPGLPLFNAAHLARQSLLPDRCKIASLPEWLAMACDDPVECGHDTMLHGSGLYDVRAKTVSQEIVERVRKLCGVTFTLNRRAMTGEVCGYWRCGNRRIPVHAGIGDHQCAVLGAGNLPGETLSINLGTGSQAAVISPRTQPDECEWRPYFDDRLLAAITRIPGGRALAGYLSFLEDVCREATGRNVTFWEMAGCLAEDDILNATLKVEPGIFSSAWRYRGGGSIKGISEGSFTLRTYLAGLLKSFAQQYVDAARLLDPDNSIRLCILSGGLARRMPVVGKTIAALGQYEVIPATAIDESLLGLRTTMLVAAGYAATCSEARNIYGRECRAADAE